MSALRAALLASLVAVSMVVPALAVPTMASSGGPVGSTAVPAVQANNSTDATVGEQISGFMQQQTSQADGAVESGMWSVAYENASEESDRAALVEQRTRGLGERLAELQAERQELVEARQNGEISPLEFRSRMSGLAGEYASLLDAVNDTEPRAEQAGANVSAVRNLRNATVEAGGPMLAVGQNDDFTPPGLSNNSTVGPPDDIPGLNDSTVAGNGTVGNGNGNGNAIANPGNGTGPGNESGVGNGNGSGVDVGSGNGNGVGVGNPVTDDHPAAQQADGPARASGNGPPHGEPDPR